MLEHLGRRVATLVSFLLLTLPCVPQALGQGCVPVALDAPALRFVGPDQVLAGGQLLLQGKGFLDGPAPTVTIGGMSAPVLAERGDLGIIVVTVPALGAGVHSVHFGADGSDSNSLCVEVVGGAGPVDCTLSGTAKDDQGNALPGTLVAALISDGEVFVQGAVADGLGNWSMDLPTGDFALLGMPPGVDDAPVPVGFQLEDLVGFTCPGGDSVDLVFATGRQRVDIDVVYDQGTPFPNADCFAESEESFSFGLSDNEGHCTFLLEPGTYELFVDTAFRSTYIAPGFLAEVILTGGSNPDPFDAVAEEGVLFCGTLVGPDGRGIGDGDVEALEVGGDNTPMGIALTASCTGEFAIAIPANTLLNFVLFPPEDFEGLPTLVKEINVSEHTQAEFPFKLQPPGPLGLTGDEPHPVFIEGSPGAPGAPVVILGHGFGGASPTVFFSAASGGARIPADDVRVDADRGLILARVPVGAGTGNVIVRAGGVDGTPIAFRLDDEPFVEGADTITGTVTDGGVPQAGALVLFFALPTGDCDDDDVIADYAITDGGGEFTLRHADGGGFFDVLPPTSANLASFSTELAAGVGDVVRNAALVPGIQVTFTVEDADSGDRIAGAQVDVETESGFDRRITNASGVAVLRLPAGGDAEGEIIPPAGSRYPEGEFQGVVAGGTMTTIGLTARNLVSGGLRSAAGPIVGGLAEGVVQVEVGDWQFLFESLTGLQGEWSGPFFNGEGLSDRFALNFIELGPDIAPLSATPRLAEARDYILYPSFVAETGGRIQGTITGAGEAGPLWEVGVQAFGLLPGGAIDWESGSTGFTRTCVDGTYSLTTTTEEHVVVANQPFGDFNDGFGEIWSTGVPCQEEATPVAVVAGVPVTLDMELPLAGRITGTVVSPPVSLEGVFIEVTDTTGGCVWYTQTNQHGFYAQPVPVGTDYRVRFDATDQGFWSACFDGNDDCLDPTLVEVSAGQDTENVDHDFTDSCPEDPDKTQEGVCGCGVPDDDTDGDGIADCEDNCPDDSNPDQTDSPDGDSHPDACDNCPDEENQGQDDGDADGTGDACDGCLEDSAKTEPGVCGCGSPDVDSDGDGLLDCNDACPGQPDDADGDGTLSCEGDACDDDPLKVAAGQCGCGEPDVGDLNEDGQSDALDCSCTPADLHPGGGVGLADWLVGWRVLNLGAPSNDRIDECGELFPGTQTTCAERALPSWCVIGEDVPAFTAEDLLVIRALGAGVLELDCSACLAGGVGLAALGDLRLPGDVAGGGRGVPDDVVDVSDVLQILRWAVGSDLDILTDELALRANVAPLTPDGGAGGDFDQAQNPIIDVGDVLVILRRAVGIIELPWPTSTLIVDTTLTGVASQHRVSGWPIWADFDSLAGCGDGGSGMDVLDGVWVATCSTYPASGSTDIQITYRAPEPVAPEGLEALSKVVDGELSESQEVPALLDEE